MDYKSSNDVLNSTLAPWIQSNLKDSISFGTFLESSPIWFRILSLSIIALIFFGVMGVAAFDYLSPNLTYIAQESGISQSVMGVTVMAFGNGSVDVFSAIVATQQGDAAMAIGEIMGGAFFVIAVVLGSMALVKPFQIEKALFIRDATILSLAVITVIFIAYDGVITLIEALFTLFLYCIYAMLVVHYHLNEFNSIHTLPTHDGALTEIIEPVVAPIKPSIFRAMDINWLVNHPDIDVESNSHDNNGDEATVREVHNAISASENNISDTQSPFLPGNTLINNANNRVHGVDATPSLRVDTSVATHSTTPIITISPTESDSDNNERCNSTSTLNISTHSLVPSSPAMPNNFSRNPSMDSLASVRSNQSWNLTIEDLVSTVMSPTSDENAFTHLMSHDEDFNNHNIDFRKMSVKETLFWICLPGYHSFSQSSWLLIIKNIIVSPFLLPLSLSIPIISFSKSRLCLGIYSISVPLIIPALIDPISYNTITFSVQIIAAVLGEYFFVYKKKVPSGAWAAALGFAMSLFWVVFLATELVKVLIALAELCELSDSFVGLTIFALGDSIGDFISNLTVARIGYSTMAIAACLGGPIFTLLIGISFSSLIWMATNHNTSLKVAVSGSILLTGIGIVATIWITILLLQLNEWVLGKRIAAVMMSIWFIVLIICFKFFKT